MAAQFLKFGDSPPNIGGEFERAAMRELRDSLPGHFIIAGNPSFHTSRSYFYEYDAVVSAPGFCEVIEFKAFRPQVTVLEDVLKGIGEFSVDQVFSRLEMKGKILSTRLSDQPFSFPTRARVGTRVVVPTESRIVFQHDVHRANQKVLNLADLKSYLLRVVPTTAKSVQESQDLCKRWERYHRVWTAAGHRTSHRLGRFTIKRRLDNPDNLCEYLAFDEPPCKVDVHLREFPFDPLLNSQELERYLDDVSREMRILRRIRHPHIACVIGHFQTESSLVQVSDWFDGQALEDSWTIVRQLSLNDKVGVLVKVADALAFCHQQGVFHRNLAAANVIVDRDVNDLRIRGFEFARDLELAQTVSTKRLQSRDVRLIPPEEILNTHANPRLSDVFQAGVLFFRILEDGAFPFENSFDYCIGESLAPMTCHGNERGISECRSIVRGMLQVAAERRPDPMSRVSAELRRVAVA